MEIREFLRAIETAYEHLYALDLQSAQIEKRLKGTGFWERKKLGTKSLRVARRPELVVLPADKLRINAIELHSPGFWDFLGSLSPLEVLRKYLQDRHERRQDREYREPAERERLRLENERLRTEVARDRIKLFQEAGVPEERIREALSVYVAQPLSELDAFQDSGMIEGAEIAPVQEPGSERDSEQLPPGDASR